MLALEIKGRPVPVQSKKKKKTANNIPLYLFNFKVVLKKKGIVDGHELMQALLTTELYNKCV